MKAYAMLLTNQHCWLAQRSLTDGSLAMQHSCDLNLRT